jgi:hypothetical protein
LHPAARVSTKVFLKTTVRNNVSVLDFIVHIVAYGGFKRSINVKTVDKAENPDTVCQSNNNIGLYVTAFPSSSLVHRDSDMTI